MGSKLLGLADEGIPDGWTVVNLEDCLEKIIDYRGKTPKKSESGILALSAKSVKMGEIDYSKAYFVSEETYEKFMVRGFPEIGDILLTTEAPLGCIAKLDRDDVCLAQRLITLRANPDVLDNEYMRFYLTSNIGQAELLNRASGSTVQGIKRTEFSKVNIMLPPSIYEQRSIAKVLSDLESKIQLNRQINQTLEEMAQAIFKSWFVDFDPVKAKVTVLENGGTQAEAELAAMEAISGKSAQQLEAMQTQYPEQYHQLQHTASLFPSAMQNSELGEIPVGWELKPLSNLIEFNPRLTLKKGTQATYLEMKGVPESGHRASGFYPREFKSGTKFCNGDTLFARITPCLENGKTCFVDFLNDGEIGWGSTEYIVMRSHKEVPKSFSYFLARHPGFRTKAIQTMTGSSGRQRANAQHISDESWITPPSEILNAFGKVADNALIFANKSSEENITLAELRDTLLPKLLSGELQISNDGRANDLNGDSSKHLWTEVTLDYLGGIESGDDLAKFFAQANIIVSRTKTFTSTNKNQSKVHFCYLEKAVADTKKNTITYHSFNRDTAIENLKKLFTAKNLTIGSLATVISDGIGDAEAIYEFLADPQAQVSAGLFSLVLGTSYAVKRLFAKEEVSAHAVAVISSLNKNDGALSQPRLFQISNETLKELKISEMDFSEFNTVLKMLKDKCGLVKVTADRNWYLPETVEFKD